MSLPFLLKRFIAQFLAPVPLVAGLFILGWALGRFTRFKRTGTAAKALSGCLFLAFGYGLGDGYLYRLERRYSPFDLQPEQCEVLRGTPVVVLGQGMPESSDLPVRYQGSAGFQCRLLEGVRVAKLVPDSRLIVSMAGEASDSLKQAALDGYMTQLNFPTNRVTMFTSARDTSDEAHLAKQILATDTRSPLALHLSPLALHLSPLTASHSLILATSASHIPRALYIFNKQGMTSIPAPCDYQFVQDQQAKGHRKWSEVPLPSQGGFLNSGMALYEGLGMLYERLTD